MLWLRENQVVWVVLEVKNHSNLTGSGNPNLVHDINHKEDDNNRHLSFDNASRLRAADVKLKQRQKQR